MKQWIFVGALALLAATAFAGHHEKGEATVDAAMDEAAAMQAMAAAATPGDAHAKLAKGVGSFKASMAFFMEPGGDPLVSQMSVERTMDLNGRVMNESWKGQVMGAPFEGRGRTGFDNVTQKYWSTWTDNMSTGLLVMHGAWDADEEAMVLHGESTHPVTGKTYKTRAVGKYLPEGKESMVMYEDHGEGEYKSMTFTLEPK
ncbi:MAG: DUF1579 family protein [Pseudomonadota bacterium]